MSSATFDWLAAGFLLLAALASIAAKALETFSRHTLQDICQRRGKPDRFSRIVLHHESAALAAECLRALSAAGSAAMFAVAVHLAVEEWNSFQVIASIVLALFALTAAIILFPQAIARHWSERYLAATWPAWRANSWVMSPLLACARLISLTGSKLAGEPERTSEEAVEEEIRTIVTEGHREGLIEEDAREMIEGVMEMREATVSEIMTPRTDMVSLSLHMDWDELVRFVVEAAHTRFPVYNNTRDDIVGLLHTKELLRELAKPAEAPRQPLANILRKPFFVPETKPINDLLQEFQRTHNHVAVVLDEFGGVSGLVSIEDVLEEIVGEIADEYDEALVDGIKTVGENQYQVAARVRIDELNERLGLNLPEDADFDTIGGFVFHERGRIPTVGEEITWRDLRIVVLDATRRRIDRVAIYVSGRSEQTAS